MWSTWAAHHVIHRAQSVLHCRTHHVNRKQTSKQPAQHSMSGSIVRPSANHDLCNWLVEPKVLDWQASHMPHHDGLEAI